MKICLVCSSFDPATVYGGPIVSNLNLAQGLHKHGADLIVLTTNANKDSRISVPTNRCFVHKEGFRVVYFEETIIGRFSSSMMINIGPYFNGADVIHVTDVFSISFLLSKFYSHKLSCPLFVSCRGVISDWGFKKRGWLKRLWLKVFIKRKSTNTVLHATSEQEKAELGVYFPEVNIVVVPNALAEITSFKTRSISNLEQQLIRNVTKNSYLIAGLGRLHKKKGFEVLIRAFSKIYQEECNIRLIIAGKDYGEANSLIALVANLELTKVVFIEEHLDNQDKNTLLERSNLFVLPSYHENFGNAYLEALSHGVPVVASIYTPWNSVVDYECGEWVDNSVDDVYHAIKRLMISDSEQLAKNARSLASQFTVSATSQKMLYFYSAAVSGNLVLQ